MHHLQEEALIHDPVAHVVVQVLVALFVVLLIIHAVVILVVHQLTHRHQEDLVQPTIKEAQFHHLVHIQEEVLVAATITVLVPLPLRVVTLLPALIVLAQVAVAIRVVVLLVPADHQVGVVEDNMTIVLI